MLSLLVRLLSGPLVGAVTGVVGKYLDAKVNKDNLQAEVEKAVLGVLADVADKQADIIKAEVNAQDQITRIWRPLAALCLLSILMFYSLVLPIAVGWFGMPPVRIGDKLLEWIVTLFSTCLGGYMAGRTLEKVVGMITSKYR